MSTINCDGLLSAKVEGICFIFRVFYFLFPIGAGNQMGLLWNVFPSGIHCLWAPHEMSGLEEWRILKYRFLSCMSEGRESWLPWIRVDSLGISWRRSIRPWSVLVWNSLCLKNPILYKSFLTWPTSSIFNTCFLKDIHSKLTLVPLRVGNNLLHVSGHFRSSLKFQALVPAWRARNPRPDREGDLGFLFDTFLLFFCHLFPV